jgi:hypothetical protein
MNEDHIIAAILAAGMIAANKDVEVKPNDAVSLYNTTLTDLIASMRPPRDSNS